MLPDQDLERYDDLLRYTEDDLTRETSGRGHGKQSTQPTSPVVEKLMDRLRKPFEDLEKAL